MLFSFLLMCCKEDPVKPVVPPDIAAGFSFVVEDTSSIEVFLRLTFDVPNVARTITLMRDTAALLTKTIFSNDTLIVDDNLLPNHFYNYTITLVDKALKRSANTTTMDTTSHNWAWELQSFGDGGGSTFYDVAIINDTLAYAVGEIYKKDSSGNYQNPPYNVAKWDGKKWELMSVLFDYNGQKLWSSIHSVFAFSANDIWFGGAIHWNGFEFETKPVDISFPSHVNKMWGTAEGELYMVGNDGLIARRSTNGNWQKLNSGTDLHIYDIYGAKNNITNGYEIYAVASHAAHSSDRKILKIDGTKISDVSSHPILYSLSSIWFVPNKYYYAVGDGIYYSHSPELQTWRGGPNNITTFYSTRVRGNNSNDFFIVGAFGDVLHFNGATWKNYRSITGLSNGSYTSVAVTNKLSIIVGGVNADAVITLGKR